MPYEEVSIVYNMESVKFVILRYRRRIFGRIFGLRTN